MILTLIDIYAGDYKFIDIDTYKTYTYTLSDVTAILSDKNSKIELCGVVLEGKGDECNLKTMYTACDEYIYLLNRIDEIGYVVCNNKGTLRKIDNLTFMLYVVDYKIANIEISNSLIESKTSVGQVKASDVGIKNVNAVTVPTKLYTGKKIDWAESITSLTVGRNRYEIKQGKLNKERAYRRDCYGIDFLNNPPFFILGRAFDKRGVRYRVYNLVENNARVVTLESIYDNYNDYVNIQVEGDIIQISDLEGVYEYDMNLIYKEYGTSKMQQSITAMKASTLGLGYSESIDVNFRLRKVSSDSTVIKIPGTAKHILPKSIHANKNNESVMFPDNIQTCAINCFETTVSSVGSRTVYQVRFNHVGIGAQGEARLQILKALESNIELLNEGAIIELFGDVSPIDFGYISMSDLIQYKKCKINGSNREGMTDNFIENVVNSIIVMRFDNFNLLKRPVEPKVKTVQGRIMDAKPSNEYTKLKREFNLFKQVYSTVLAPGASAILNKKVNMFISHIEETIKMRDRELKETIRYNLSR